MLGACGVCVGAQFSCDWGYTDGLRVEMLSDLLNPIAAINVEWLVLLVLFVALLEVCCGDKGNNVTFLIEPNGKFFFVFYQRI